MTGKREIVRRAARKKYGSGRLDALKIEECSQMYDIFEEVLTEALINGEQVKIKGLFTAEVKERPARRGRNPRTNEVQQFPAVKSVSFKISQRIKDIVNGKWENETDNTT